jgi:TRAP-type mannitol/chloroaromatic compound transport system permease small subunit
MQRILFWVDGVSAFAGKAFAWAIVLLTLIVCYDVAATAAFRKPIVWAFDAAYMCYGALFMMAGAYTLSRNGHVRGDVLYSFLPPRVQAALDFLLYFLFFIPGIAALSYAGVGFAEYSWQLNEHSSVSSNGPPLYHFKALIPIAGALVMLQGLAEIARCVICLKTGAWPRRAHDVEEVDVEELKAAVHFKEEDAPPPPAGDYCQPSAWHRAGATEKPA